MGVIDLASYPHDLRLMALQSPTYDDFHTHAYPRLVETFGEAQLEPHLVKVNAITLIAHC